MNDILTIQRYVIANWLMNHYTEKITSVHKHCFEGGLAEIYSLIKKQYIETGSVDMVGISYDFDTLVEITNENLHLSLSIDSCVTKLNAYRSEKANRYIGSKLTLGEITESEAIDLLNKKMEITEEKVSKGKEIAAETYQKLIERFEQKQTLKTGLIFRPPINPDIVNVHAGRTFIKRLAD
jgi:hypothetical protein